MVNGDVAGRTGTGTLASQQTGTIPGGEKAYKKVQLHLEQQHGKMEQQV